MGRPNRPVEGVEPENSAVSAGCGICGESIDEAADDLMLVECSQCDSFKVHRECAVTFLEARGAEKSNSHAAAKYIVKARRRPQDLFNLGMPCPNGAYKLKNRDERQGVAAVGSQRYTNSRALTGACPGFTKGAEVVKAQKQAPPPLPPEALAPARPAGKAKGKAAGAPAPAQPPPAKRPSTTGAGGSGVKVVGQAHAAWVTVGGHKGGGGPRAGGGGVGAARGAGAAARIFGAQQPQRPTSVPGAEKAVGPGLSFPPGKRPEELQLCEDYEDVGECYTYQCKRAHGIEQLRQREREWAARQDAQKREAARRQAQAEAEARRRREEEAVERARLASLASAAAAPRPVCPAPVELRLPEACLALMRQFKKSACLNHLLEMEFPIQAAQAATDAAAGDTDRAVQLLLDGRPCFGAPPVDIAREAAELSSLALALGADAAAVEACLRQAGGNWVHAAEALRSGGGSLGGGFDGAAFAESDYQSTVGLSEPETPSISGPLPAWAADASSAPTTASPYAQSPRASSGALAAAGTSASRLAPSPEPGVLSLADFSADAEGPPAAGSGAFGSPLPARPGAPPASASDDPWAKLQAQAVEAAQAAGYYGGVPPPEERPLADEAEVEELMAMLGIQ